MHNAGAQGMDIDDVEPEHMSVPLESAIRALAEEDSSDDRTFLLTTYLPVCAELGSETKGILARDTDFFVREGLAAYLTQRPRFEDLALAEQLSRDRHSQVARQAEAAAAAIRHVVQAGPRH